MSRALSLLDAATAKDTKFDHIEGLCFALLVHPSPLLRQTCWSIIISIKSLRGVDSLGGLLVKHNEHIMIDTEEELAEEAWISVRCVCDTCNY